MYISSMADIFIGYARHNRTTTEQLAGALEAAGYSVWWDRQIMGGAEFSKDIERELDAARAVIIVWSGASRESPWVKDEAAVARDQGKLVPVSLDAEPPPMGFRQYQAVDFSGWDGSGDNAAFGNLLRAVQARISGLEPSREAAPYAPPLVGSRFRTGLVITLVAVVLIAAFAVFQFADRKTADSSSAGPADAAQAEDTVKPASNNEPRIALAGFKVRNDDPELENFAAALGEDIASGLARFSYLLVSSETPGPVSGHGGAAYLLEGTLQRSGSTLRLSTQLLDVASGRQVWGETFDREYSPQNILELQDDLTDHVVALVADPYGALMRDLARPVALKSPAQMTPYETVLRHFIYRQRVGAEDHLETRNALEGSVEQAPGNADVWAALAAIYAEEYKHDYNPLPGSLDRALTAARKAVDLEPDNAYARFVLAEVHFFRQETGAFFAAAERAIELNPRDSDAMAMIGIMTGYSGDWERGIELTTRAMALNPNHPGWYHFNRIFNEYRLHNYEQALALAERVNLPNYFADPYARAIAHAQLGHHKEAAKALDELQELWPGVSIALMRDSHLNKWFYAQPTLIDQTIEGLLKAGLE